MRGRIAILAWIASAAICRASDAPMDRATLRGLKAMNVAVDLSDAEMESWGVSKAALAKQIEERLGKAGITVDRNAAEFVGLRVTAAHAKKTSYALCLALGAYQVVSLARQAGVKTIAETWSTESVVLVPPKMLDSAMRTTVDELVDQFVRAFHEANPGAARLEFPVRRMMYGCFDFDDWRCWRPARPA
jgi:hypothetical protein